MVVTVKPILADTWWMSHKHAPHEVLWSAVFLNEKLDNWIRFACRPFSMVPSQVFWQEDPTEVLKSARGFSHSLVCSSPVSWHTCCFDSSISPTKTCSVPVYCLLCLSRLRGASCKEFLQHRSMLSAPLPVWLHWWKTEREPQHGLKRWVLWGVGADKNRWAHRKTWTDIPTDRQM